MNLMSSLNCCWLCILIVLSYLNKKRAVMAISGETALPVQGGPVDCAPVVRRWWIAGGTGRALFARLILGRKHSDEQQKLHID